MVKDYAVPATAKEPVKEIPASGAEPPASDEDSADADSAGPQGNPEVDEESETAPLPWRGLDVGSPFEYAKQGILYVAAHLPRPAASGLPDAAGEAPETFDKDFIRRWVVSQCDPYKEEVPPIPEDVILQAAAQVRHLNRRYRPRDPAVLLRVQLLLTRVNEHPVAVDEAVVVLAFRAIVERDRIQRAV